MKKFYILGLFSFYFSGKCVSLVRLLLFLFVCFFHIHDHISVHLEHRPCRRLKLWFETIAGRRTTNLRREVLTEEKFKDFQNVASKRDFDLHIAIYSRWWQHGKQRQTLEVKNNWQIPYHWKEKKILVHSCMTCHYWSETRIGCDRDGDDSGIICTASRARHCDP